MGTETIGRGKNEEGIDSGAGGGGVRSHEERAFPFTQREIYSLHSVTYHLVCTFLSPTKLTESQSLH